MLSMVIFGHGVNNGIHFCYFMVSLFFKYFFLCLTYFLYVFNLKFTPIQQSTALPPLLSDL